MASTQIKIFTVLFLSTLILQKSVAQKLTDVTATIYMAPPLEVPSDPASNSPDIVLPIVLKSWEATAYNLQNIITWTTLSEQNVKEFVIERSTNPSNNWGVIATIMAGDNHSEGVTRTFNDVNPNCLSYYRLRSVDFDGKENISKVISVERNCLKSKIKKAYPNPTQASLNINFDAPQSGILTLAFTDLLGRVILQKQVDAIEGENNISADLSDLKNGLYFVTFTDNHNIATQLIEKN